MAAAKSKMWIGASKAAEEAYKQIKKNPQPLYVFVGFYTLVTILSLVLQGKASIFEKGYHDYAGIAMLYFVLPITVYGFAIADKKQLEVDDFLNVRLKKWLMLLGTAFLTGVLLIGSFLLLIFPFIWAVGWFALAIYAAVDKDLNPVEALKESKRISQEHKSKVWGVVGFSIVVSIVAGIVSVVPYIGAAASAAASVLTTAVMAKLYRWLQAE
jgi:hypothetical protein